MSSTAPNPQERAFLCIHCNGRIVIPADLPPTTGPCPHCRGTITSPALDTPSVASAPTPQPKPAAAPAAAPAPAPTPPEPSKPATPVSYEAPEELKEKEAEKAKKSGKKSSPLGLLVVLILLLGILGGGGYFAMEMLKKKDEGNQPFSFKKTNKPETNPTLEQFMAGQTLDEKLIHVYNAEALRPKIEAFYRDKPISDTDTPANLFTSVKIPEADSKKGFNLFSYNQPATGPNAGPSSPPTKILAFLKETEGGVKIDWEVFVQTKHHTLYHFLKTPTVGKTEVFRVIITKNPGSKNGTYLITDPVHSNDSVEIAPDPKSPAGIALAALAQESTKTGKAAKRTATIELTWTGDPRKPQLQISRFICWEFLGLGGKEGA